MAVRKKPSSKRKAGPAKKAGRKASASKRTRKAAAKKKPAKTASAAKKRARTKSAAKKAVSKKASSGKARSDKPATKKAASKKAASKKSPGRKAAQRSAPKGARERRPGAGSALSPAAPAVQRQPARKAARRVPPVRSAEPRSVGVRKVGVRTAVQTQTSRAPRPQTGRAGKASPAELVQIVKSGAPRQEEVLSPEALEFLALLHRQFNGRRLSLLARRHERQARLDAGELPDFLPETRHVRSSGWRVTGLSSAWFERRDEIVAAAEQDHMAAALGSGAASVVVDFEEAAPPVWTRVMAGHLALRDLWAGLSSAPKPLVIVSPRSWHMPEAHVTIEGDLVSGALFDAGLALVHCARRQVALQAAPVLRLAKLESYLEARLWSDVLRFAERHFGLPRGTCKIDVAIETLPAVFEMDEIIFELREHIAALSFVPAGMAFSFIRRLGSQPRFLMPQRADLNDERGFVGAAASLLAQTCRRRGIGLLGAPAAEDGPAQPERGVERDRLLTIPAGARTLAGLREGVALALRHLSAWLEPRTAEPALTREAELARALAWQWVRHGAALADAGRVGAEMIRTVIEDESAALGSAAGTAAAAHLLFELATAPDCEERLSSLVYRDLVERGF